MQKSQSVHQTDRKAEEYLIGNNSVILKASRKQVVKILFQISRVHSANLQILPQYARLVAIINQYCPDIGQDMTQMLQNEFFELQSNEQNELTNYDVKIRNIRFLGELTKFGIFLKDSPERMLENLQVCLDKFYGQNIDIACNLLESCGRYLLNSLDDEDYKALNEMLDLMWRLKEKDKISSSQLANIDQAYHICRPSNFSRNGQSALGHPDDENLNTIEQFIRHILQTLLLQEGKVERVSQLMLKMPWDVEHEFILRQLLTLLLYQAKFSDMKNLALLIKSFKEQKDNAALQRFVTEFFEALFEEVYR